MRGAVINAVSIKGIGKVQLALTEGLCKVFERLGKPQGDIKSPHFWLMIDNIVQVWSKVFPHELEEFKETVSDQRKTERSLKDSIAKGLCQQYALPMNLFKMLRVFFRDMSFTSKDFVHQFTSRYPFFKTTEHKL
jgi:hypothetical protein